MRILELHAPYFRERWRRTHDVLAWGPAPHCDLVGELAPVPLEAVLAALPPGWRPDAIVLGDDSRSLLVLGLERAPCPTVFLSVDTHHHAAWHAPLAAACDVAFVAQPDHLPAFAAAGAGHARWLPPWAPDELPPPAAATRHALAFVGSLDPRTHPDRVALLEEVARWLPLHVGEGRWQEVYAQSRIVLNTTVAGDVNFRVFEALASGALLLTERTGNGLLDLFADGRELVTYPRGNVTAVVEAACALLADEGRRAAIAARGRARVRAAHLESHRAAAVLAALDALPARRPAAARRAGAAQAYARLAHRAQCALEVFGAVPFYAALHRAYVAAAAALAPALEQGAAEQPA
ncbi:MAG TPA: glycosyltransferase [Candidatus Binatia bacterium]|nr:glycosyltransferase [Candidatus Binatia bacterium]